MIVAGQRLPILIATRPVDFRCGKSRLSRREYAAWQWHRWQAFLAGIVTGLVLISTIFYFVRLEPLCGNHDVVASRLRLVRIVVWSADTSSDLNAALPRSAGRASTDVALEVAFPRR